MQNNKYDCLKLENQLCFPLYACSKEVSLQLNIYTAYLSQVISEQFLILLPGLSQRKPHKETAVRAFKNGLHVMCDKPSGVYSRQADYNNYSLNGAFANKYS